jgi:transcription factor IIIB subunit 2
MSDYLDLQQGPRSKGSSCPNCQSREIFTDQKNGHASCMGCGYILEAAVVDSSVQFTEDASGASSAVGQFISSTGSSLGRESQGIGYDREISREQRIAAGKRKIQAMAGYLNINTQIVEKAHRLFMLALEQKFTQGRKTQYVVAACLYIACRMSKQPFMLVDFSDVLQTNIFILGATYIKLRDKLGYQTSIPNVDPSIFIHRFASMLDFGQKFHKVSMAALRLVAQMRRDWMQTGRRPSGICGVCLMIAGSMYGFKRTPQEIGQVVRISGVTVYKRLQEFKANPVASLTVQDFLSLEDPSNPHKPLVQFPELDPPAFVRNRRKRLSGADPTKLLQQTSQQSKIRRFLIEYEAEVSSSGAGIASEPANQASLDSPADADDAALDEAEGDAVLEEAEAKELASLGEALPKPVRRKRLRAEAPLDLDASTSDASAADHASLADPTLSLAEVAMQGGGLSNDEMQALLAVSEEGPASEVVLDDEALQAELLKQQDDDERAKQIELKQQHVQAWLVEQKKTYRWDTEILDMDEGQLNSLLLSNADAEKRKRLWTRLNQDWLDKQAELKLQEEEARKAGKPFKPTRKRVKKDFSAGSAAEATMKALGGSRSTVSNKINYGALESLFDPSQRSRSKVVASELDDGDDDDDDYFQEEQETGFDARPEPENYDTAYNNYDDDV